MSNAHAAGRHLRPAWLGVALLAGWAALVCAEGGIDFGDGVALEGATAAFVAMAVAAPAAAAAAWLARDRAVLRSRPALLAVGGVAGMAAWSALSILWALAPDLAWIEVNRTLLVLAAVVAGAALGSLVPQAPARFAMGLALAAAPAIAWGLGSKVAPTVLGADGDPSRLETPVGYWNALALVAVVAVPGVAWVAARPGAGRASVAGAGAAMAAVGVTLMLTYSRGGLLALVVAAGLVLWLVPGRRRALAALVGGAVGAALPAAYGLTAGPLTAEGLPAAARRDAGIGLGWRLLVGLAVAAVVAPLVALGLARLSVPQPRRAARVAIATVAVVLVAAFAVVVSARVIGGGRDAVANDPGRLTSLETNNRVDWWTEALRGFAEAPVQGNGAGSFPLVHLRERTQGEDRLRVRQPHQLVLQAMAETGLVGLLLLAAAVAGVAWAAVRACRAARDPAVGLPAAVAAAVLVQAQLDWSWSVPALATAAAGAGGVLLAAAAPGPAPATARAPRALAPVLGALALLAVVSAVLPWWSQEQVAAGNRAAAAGRPGQADARADEARALNPLSIEPLLLRARAAALRGDPVRVLEALREATRVQPDNPQAWQTLARVAGAETPEGRAAWRRVLALDPQDAAARAALAIDPGS